MSFFINFLKRFLHNMLQLLSFGRKTIANSLSIYVKTNTGNTISVDLDPKWDIKNVKEFVAPQLGLQPEELKIIFAGKELGDSIVIEECDLGNKSILHAVKCRKRAFVSSPHSTLLEEVVEEGSKPLCETLVDLQLTSLERSNISEEDRERSRAHFYVHCGTCGGLRAGKLRVRCSICSGGAFTVWSDPQCWADVLKPHRILGECESREIPCTRSDGAPPFAEFYFKCAEHCTDGERDEAVPLSLVKSNLRNIPCLACTDIRDPVLVFPCVSGHVTCLDCFRHYCSSRLADRQFVPHEELGYTLPCPAGCENSYVEEIHHFRLLTHEQYDRYQRFATEEFVLQSGGVLCPQPGCGMGILMDPDCRKVQCLNGCGFVFCRSCLQGYHIGECLPDTSSLQPLMSSCEYTVDPNRAQVARWDEATKVTIKVSTKPCPKCRTPTERDGGCMHMVCTRAGCNFDWCWVCQEPWTRECMGSHWFG
ncbi:E3 ubiquitin-protein ligase parkin [Ctenocephalides felis]|uniref:E3 ubiquitin-protein ligase parkin n=1 Tax=Ctenocephalides felis TaxID=7515 RepID=UPI000E6E368D|nr:E3 ubiquitin-protein ligase parkin [Ctenocephalides felis]